jgi:hypothetical protein
MRSEREGILGDADVRERLRAAADDVAERLRTAADSAMVGRGLERHQRGDQRGAYRARQAREWARTHWVDLKDGVERRPYSATAWALGLGLLTGVVLTSMVRTRREY